MVDYVRGVSCPMPLMEIAMTFFLSVIGMIICLSIMYISISRMTNLLFGAVIAGVGIPILLNVVWFALLPFVTVRDYPQASFPVPTGPSVAIMVSCWVGPLILFGDVGVVTKG